MTEDELIDLLDKALDDPARKLGAGVVRDRTPMEIVRFYTRSVKFSRVPIIGKSLSIVAVVRCPDDLANSKARERALLQRAAELTSARYPPRRALSIALTAVAICAQPITPECQARAAAALFDLPRQRCVPLGLFLVHLPTEGLAIGLRRGPDGLYNEPERVADALSAQFRQFLPLIQGETI